MDEILLSLEHLTKRYSKENVVNDVTLNIKKGSIYGLIGKNGAGKTTIMKIITGLIHPTSGIYNYHGFKCSNREVFTRIGTLIETPAFYDKMTTFDNLRIKALAYGIRDKKYVEEKLDFVGLSHISKKRVNKLSLGMKQRLAIAMTLIGEPDVLVLDEPINALDPQGIINVRELLVSLNREKGTTIIISSHILEELSKIATDYAIIDKGRIIEESTLEELKGKCIDRITIKCEPLNKAIPLIEEMGISKYKILDGNTIEIYERIDETADINRVLVMNQINVKAINSTNKSMEQYFVEITNNNGGGNE